ncbi:MAG: DUF2975 domain-containing protein [Gammaproteobacteria bacterium]|nr:DUF2975 domain-containing protein [Gammaproteobacteria bacterium]
MEKIKTVSGRFRILFQLIFFTAPIGVFLFWLTVKTPHDVFTVFGISAGIITGHMITLNALTRILAFFASLIPTGIFMYGLHQLIKLFRNYQKGKIFELKNVNYYRKLGYALLAWVLGGFLYDALISFILTFQNPHAHRIIAIGINSGRIVSLFASGIIILIAWVMKEAYLIHEDGALVI